MEFIYINACTNSSKIYNNANLLFNEIDMTYITLYIMIFTELCF